jgi:ATP-dependent DNA helicase RecG
VRRHIAQGNAQLVIGTHALLEEKVEFAKIGLVIVDEQHRFGVMQRLKLMRKSSEGEESSGATGSETRPHTAPRSQTTVAEPDVLVMTATPIPRTLALTLYGDLDFSVLDELPPGRTPIVTRLVPDERSPEVWEFVRKQVTAGHQVYVVYPVIEENEESELKAALKMYRELSGQIFADLKVGLLHGRLDPDLKDQVVWMFQKGELQILVATTVIEVGVDVPNATVMMIEGADRFGLAQLHQFRGRVGRGAGQSHCLLLTDDPTEPALNRLGLVTQIRDGFKLAEEDMRIRGMGELMGSRQHGMSDLAMQALQQPELLNEVRQEAERLLEADPGFAQNPLLKAAVARRLELTSIS